MALRNISINVNEKETVSGILSIPAHHTPGNGTGIIIAHGSGNDMHHPLLASYADALTASGCICLRFNFPYKEKGRTSPDTPKRLTEAWLGAFQFLKQDARCRPRSIIAAGKSLGGRIASQMAADKILTADRLIFLGYPLHAPGKKDKLRDAHLYTIDQPMLFFAGTRDPLCDLDTLNTVLTRLKAKWDFQVIEGGDHSFKLPKTSPLSFQEVIDILAQKTLSWIVS